MEISFINSSMASPSLTPTKDAECLGEYLDGIQSNSEHHDTMMADHATPSEEGVSIGEGTLGFSDDGVDPTIDLELSSGHGEGTHSFSFPPYLPITLER